VNLRLLLPFLLLLVDGGAKATTTDKIAFCELHVWGARQSMPLSSKFAAPFAVKGSYHAKRSEPLSNINVLDPALRLSKLPDATFIDYFGSGVPVVMVRHADPVEPATVKKTKAPMSASTAACRGDLILSNLVDIEFPNGQPKVGILTATLMAPAGMNMVVDFRRFDGRGRMIFAKRDGVNGDLRISRSRWYDNSEDALAAIDESVADGIRRYAIKHLGAKKPPSAKPASDNR
jgi:hypothetical protein